MDTKVAPFYLYSDLRGYFLQVFIHFSDVPYLFARTPSLELAPSVPLEWGLILKAAVSNKSKPLPHPLPLKLEYAFTPTLPPLLTLVTMALESNLNNR